MNVIVSVFYHTSPGQQLSQGELLLPLTNYVNLEKISFKAGVGIIWKTGRTAQFDKYLNERHIPPPPFRPSSSQMNAHCLTTLLQTAPQLSLACWEMCFNGEFATFNTFS